MRNNASANAIPTLLHQVGGVYRDPTRVSRDATTLLRSPAGSNLRPSVSPLVQNDGTSTPPVLQFSGTIGMTYKGSTYNIPIDLYLPPPYPIRPPVCFVRPVSSMMIKENHKHVAQDGMVYMPYLHGWRPHSHNLVELVVAMGSLFGTDPPVFSKPPGYRASVASSASSTASSSVTASVVRPPSYSDIEARKTAEAIAQVEAAKRAEELRLAEERERSQREARDAIAQVEAAKRAEEARVREEKERREREAREAARRRELEEERATVAIRQRLTSKLQGALHAYYNASRESISSDLKDQAKLETSTKIVETNLQTLKEQRETLKDRIETVDEATKNIQTFLEQNEGDDREEIHVDDRAHPGDVHSAQMLHLAAENAAITDALYFLDKGLARGTIELDEHLKHVRRLAKKQFLARAHLMKIAQVRAAGGA